MRTVQYKTIVNTVRQMCMEANYDLPEEVMDAFRTYMELGWCEIIQKKLYRVLLTNFKVYSID